ncbi:glycoside hydrolase family 19 protein [Tardiphaga sp.]|jgi:predicted chitinase|uniref:glycoside hydrolase family 19 protein n=1 Tax=Tardiphaga sp. TaxID=1926292 RepID=UPI0037D99DDB
MPIKLTTADLRGIFPRAPQAVIDAFASKQDVLTKAGINATKTRLAYFFANIEHECGGFTIKDLTENINYTASRMAQVWPNRFKSASAVQAKYGQAAGWQKKAFDDIYGNRMGNRPGTSDGSTYIGRGGPQWTGRDGYAALERLTSIPAVATPSLASSLSLQPEICAAFWTWKNLNRFADANDFLGCVKAWNGGTNGLADRQALMAGNDPILKKLESVATITSAAPEPKEPANKTTVALAAVGSTAGAGGIAAAHQQGISALSILGWMGGLTALVIAAFIIGYRITKGHWPWTSTGEVSQEPSPLSPPSSAPSSAQLSVAQSALQLAALQGQQSQLLSESKKRRKQSAKPSQKTRTRRASSSSSKRSAVKKSSPKRKSKSKS